MRICFVCDPRYFLIHINGEPAIIGEEQYNEVIYGDNIVISTNYKRDFYVNGVHAGLHDKGYDLQYQSIYTVVPDEPAGFTSSISLSYGEGDEPESHFINDTFPYVLSPVYVSSPWDFFGTDGIPRRVSAEDFAFRQKTNMIAELFRTSGKPGRIPYFRCLSSIDDYEEFPNNCGIVKYRGEYIFVLNDGEGLLTKPFSELSKAIDFAVSTYVTVNAG